MMKISKSPLEAWAVNAMGLPYGHRFNPDRLADYQLEKLNQTLAHAATRSPFYKKHFQDCGTLVLDRLVDLARLPFTTAETLRQSPLQQLCVSQGEVARVVTLQTSGTTGDPKRIYFCDGDLERTLDFFQYGLLTMAASGERMLILLPGGAPDSAANLLQRAAARAGVDAVIHGLVEDPAKTIQVVIQQKINCLVGIPVQLLSLVRHPDAVYIPAGMLKSVLLSTDYVPRAIVDAIRTSWGCAVFEHYGMTEMGYGGAMSCAAHEGYHLRDADILFEIIDPVTLRPAPDGHWGEVVFTTLNHRAMPLIRYRTGDLAAFIPQPCPCGAGLRRMQWVQGRRNEVIDLKDGSTIDLASLDEMLFALPNVVNFEVVITRKGNSDHLQVTLFCIQSHELDSIQAAAALRQVPGICRAENGGALVLDPITIVHGSGDSGPVVKRKIRDERNR